MNIMSTCYSLAIRYDRLRLLSMNAFQDYKDADSINIFIDLYPIFRSIYKQDYLEGTNLDLCSGIINLAAHYKQFFKSFCKEIKIYLIHSNNIPIRNIQLYEDYNKEMRHRIETRTSIIQNIEPMNLDILDLLCKYIEDVYIVHSTYESSVVMYDIISKDNINNKVNLIISRDSYPFQLTTICPNTVLFRPLKKGGEDSSYYVNKDNVFNAVMYDRKTQKRDFLNINPKLYSMIFTLNGIKRRKIKLEYQIQTAINLVKNAIDNNLILNDYNFIIDWNQIQAAKDPNLLQARYECIDIISQHSIFKNDIESNYNFQDLYDPKTLQNINNQYFGINNQLNLNAL